MQRNGPERARGPSVTLFMLDLRPTPEPDAVPALPPPPVALAQASLFFDLDGTLIDIAEVPDAVVVPPTLAAAAAKLAAALPGRVAILSGRSLAQLDAILGPFARSIAVAASHGAERRLPGDDAPATLPPAGLAAATGELAEAAERLGVLLERKTMGAALHYRRAPKREGEAGAAAEAIAARHGLVLQRGKMMVELRAPGDKGRALLDLLETPAMAGTRPLFFGDDVTDEDGFAAAAAAGGAGVLVGAPRATAATYGLPDPDAVRRWIEEAAEQT
jgi:trehalose 6-phosphate phosphatase